MVFINVTSDCDYTEKRGKVLCYRTGFSGEVAKKIAKHITSLGRGHEVVQPENAINDSADIRDEVGSEAG